MATGKIIYPMTEEGAGFDYGMRRYMLRIYSYMCGGLLLTGTLALLASQSTAFLNAMYVIQLGNIVAIKPLAWAVMLSPLAFTLFLSFGLGKMTLAMAQLSFWAYAGLMGLSISSFFLTFTGQSMAECFFITAGAFAGLSLFGYSTRQNIAPLGAFLTMSIIGLVLAGIVNLFFQNALIDFAYSILAVLAFSLLTAVDTQRLKNIYADGAAAGEWLEKLAVLGALTLYLDFINIFLNLLNLSGRRRK